MPNPQSKPKFKTTFGPVIANHWRNNFPREAQALEKAGELESAADRAAEKSAAVASQALQTLNYHQAHELATEMWGTPPAPTTAT